MGGVGSMKRTGAAYDGFRGEVRTGSAAEKWMSLYGLQKTSSYQISRYGERGAQLCADTWCSIMQRFFDIWEAQPVPRYVYTQEDTQALPVNAELQALLDTVPAAAKSRVESLLQIRAPTCASSASSK